MNTTPLMSQRRQTQNQPNNEFWTSYENRKKEINDYRTMSQFYTTKSFLSRKESQQVNSLGNRVLDQVYQTADTTARDFITSHRKKNTNVKL